MNLQKEFEKEQYNRRYVENERGYICYNVYGDGSVYVHQLYVLPGHRRSGTGTELERLLIEKETPEVIFCDVDLRANNPEASLSAIFTSGYKIHSQKEGLIILCKKLKKKS